MICVQVGHSTAMVAGSYCVTDCHGYTGPTHNKIVVFGIQTLALRYDPETKGWMARHCDDGESCQICLTYEPFVGDLERRAKCVILTEIASHCKLACERSANVVLILSILCVSRKPHLSVGISFNSTSMALGYCFPSIPC
jgi:hypothetical protein